MQKELDLTTANIANTKYDIERMKRKSIQDSSNSKRQVIQGELYRGKRVNKRLKQRVALIAATVVVGLGVTGVHKIAEYNEIVSTYDTVLYKEANKELSPADSIKFLESYDVSRKQKHDNYIEALESLDDADYDFFGNREDGTHNNTTKIDAETFQLSDQQKDAIDLAVSAEVEEYKGSRK